jgi:hypothetical protein
MQNQFEPVHPMGVPASDSRNAGMGALHSLQDLPSSLGYVSSGPLGSVARKDHISWRTKGLTDPSYWCGRVDASLGRHLAERPIHKIGACFGIGLLMGLVVSGISDSYSSWR